MYIRDYWNGEPKCFPHNMDTKSFHYIFINFCMYVCFKIRLKISFWNDCVYIRFFIGIHIFRAEYRWCPSLVKIAILYFKCIYNYYSNHNSSFLSTDRSKKICYFLHYATQNKRSALFKHFFTADNRTLNRFKSSLRFLDILLRITGLEPARSPTRT